MFVIFTLFAENKFFSSFLQETIDRSGEAAKMREAIDLEDPSWKYGDRILTAGDTFTMPPSAVTLTAVWKEWHGEGIYGDDSAADPLGYLEKIYVSVEVNNNNEILSVAADAVIADTAASQEDLEILEFGKALEWVNNQLLYFDIVSGGADSLEMYYYMAEGSDFLYAQPIIGGVMTALQQDPKPLITVNVKDEQDNLLSTISGIRYGTRFTAAVPEAPVKPEDASNTYAFTGWDETTIPAILTADAEVTACYMAAAKDPKDITAAVISDIAPVSYTGSPITPAFTVTEAGENGRVLTKGKNFKVSYSDNTDAGTASVTVTGIGAYSGKQTKYFQILPRQVTPVVTLEKDAYVYDGAGKRPSVIVTVDPPAIASSDNGSGENGSTKPWGDAIELPAIPVNGRASSQAVGSFLSDDTAVNAQTETRTVEQEDTQAGVQTELQTDTESVSEDREFAGQDQDSAAPILLKAGDDYDVSYPDGCVRAGTYTVTVTLKGNYTGTGEAQFTISPRTFDGKELIQNTDYTVKYENNINAGTAAVVVTGKGDVSLLEMVHTSTEKSGLGVTGLSLSVIIGGIDVGNGNVVHLLDGRLDLKLVGLTVYDKAITVQFVALIRQLLSNDWLNNDSHLQIILRWSYLTLSARISWTPSTSTSELAFMMA